MVDDPLAETYNFDLDPSNDCDVLSDENELCPAVDVNVSLKWA